MASEEVHCVLVPLMAQGHIIPLTDFGLQLAHRGLTVTIITNPANAIRYKPTIDHATTTCNLRIKLLSVPRKKPGLRQGCENKDSLTVQNIKLTKVSVEKLLRGLVPRPSCVVYDHALFWMAEIASNFKIQCYKFYTISSFTSVCEDNILKSKIRDRLTSDTESFVVPRIPHNLEFKWSQVSHLFAEPDHKKEKQKATLDDEKDEQKAKSDDKKDEQKPVVYPVSGYLFNSFEEMETGYIDRNYIDTHGKKVKVWGIGPVCLCNNEISDKFNRGNKPSIDKYDCIKWLDSMKPGSVIYACFGSQSHMTWTQLSQVGIGLQMWNKPFIWVVRENEHIDLLETWLEHENFEENVQGRGLIIRGWAPQVLILSHPSIGGFLTHCGWNSTLEGVCAGVRANDHFASGF